MPNKRRLAPTAAVIINWRWRSFGINLVRRKDTAGTTSCARSDSSAETVVGDMADDCRILLGLGIRLFMVVLYECLRRDALSWNAEVRSALSSSVRVTIKTGANNKCRGAGQADRPHSSFSDTCEKKLSDDAACFVACTFFFFIRAIVMRAVCAIFSDQKSKKMIWANSGCFCLPPCILFAPVLIVRTATGREIVACAMRWLRMRMRVIGEPGNQEIWEVRERVRFRHFASAWAHTEKWQQNFLLLKLVFLPFGLDKNRSAHANKMQASVDPHQFEPKWKCDKQKFTFF